MSPSLVRDNARDRQTGATWERQFCVMAAGIGKVFTPHQLAGGDRAASAFGRDERGRWEHLLLPDVTIWSAPGEHHEIKHKDKTRQGGYGLELYRLRPLIRFANRTGQVVYYTIHDWRVAGAKTSRDDVGNNISHWFCANIADLSRSHSSQGYGPSYVNGRMETVEIRYWDAGKFFRPLAEVWQIGKAA